MATEKIFPASCFLAYTLYLASELRAFEAYCPAESILERCRSFLKHLRDNSNFCIY